MALLQIDIPDDLLTDDTLTHDLLEQIAREALLVRLYDQAHISSGWGAQVLGIARHDFLDLLGTYGVSEFDDAIDIAEEVRIASIASRFKHQSAD